MDSSKRLIRVDLYAKRNPNLTIEQFHEHWQNVHVPLVNKLVARHPGIKRYSTYFIPPELQEKVSKGPIAILDCDGHAEFLADSLEDIAKMREDPFYKEQVGPDEMKLLDLSSAVQSIAYETIQLNKS